MEIADELTIIFNALNQISDLIGADHEDLSMLVSDAWRAADRIDQGALGIAVKNTAAHGERWVMEFGARARREVRLVWYLRDGEQMRLEFA